MTKVALVTGASRGIGRAIACELAKDHHVVITWRSTPPDALPASILPLRADLTKPERPAQIISDIIARFGRLDVIVNNAGQVTQNSPEHFDAKAAAAMFDINLFAAQALLTAARPHLGAGAAIINISSVNAQLPPMGASLFGASKAALDLWTRGMAKELGPHQIRVNGVAPGAVEDPDAPRPEVLVKAFTDLTAMGQLATPDDIAQAVRFLTSAAASSITGEILTVSGGYRL